ncbi:MAG: protein-disulfide reductase DsbD [Methylovulum miyakonense]|uniref:protein-disulfide reductase DsbD n=1 Tax=Methylovulum miyakonense TaxID=645578 RepID=UPI003BB800FA
MSFFKIIIFCWLVLLGQVTFAIDDGLLPPAQAFKLSAQALSAGQLQVSWEIAEGYSVYRNNMRVQAKTDNIQLGDISAPDGIIKHDEFLGDVVHYHNKLQVLVPIKNSAHAETMKLFVQYQACADRGVCYPPQKQTLDIKLVNAAVEAKANPLAQLAKRFSGFIQAPDELLPPNQAFGFFASVKDANTLRVNWKISDGYYLYREKFQLTLTQADGIQLGVYTIPNGTPKHDEAFGQVEIFHNELAFDLPLVRTNTAAQTLTLEAKYQGCADRGVCYPPMSTLASLDLPAVSPLSAPSASAQTAPVLSEQDAIVQSLHKDSAFMTLLSFFGFGLLLAFTPCIFPMIPILSGIIVGHGHRISTLRAFLLSLSYVLASAAMYTVFGVLAALFGHNLQATFQQPWIIVLFSVIFVLLSLSMFGFYHVELPKSFQVRLHNSSERHRDGSLWGAAIMGALSSLIVGPCVAAPLAGALIFISQTGDALLGGAALFFMGLGMGVPLLVLGASARHLLPRAGDWLNTTKVVFGVIMLAVAVWMLGRILPAAISMALWAMLLVLPSVYLNALEPLPPHCSGWRKLWKGLGLMMLAYGVLLLVGVGMGNSNPLRPLQGFAVGGAPVADTGLRFTKVASLAELDAKVAAAAANHQPVMLDFYADWCISCKEMEAYTFTDARVKQSLARFVLLQADVTANNTDDQALLAKYQLIGPPAILFFGADRQEQAQQRVVGYQDAETFIKTLERIKL